MHGNKGWAEVRGMGDGTRGGGGVVGMGKCTVTFPSQFTDVWRGT